MPERSALRTQRMLALFLLGWVLFSYPLLAVFADAGIVFGVPVVFPYLFGAWAAFIAILALAARGG